MSMIPVLVQREFSSRVKGTAYIVTTIIGVLVFVALSFLPPIMQRISSSLAPGTIELVVYEQPGEESIVPYLEQVGAEREGFIVHPAGTFDESEAYRKVLDEGLSGLLLVDGPLYTFVTTDASNMMLNDEIQIVLNQVVVGMPFV